MEYDVRHPPHGNNFCLMNLEIFVEKLKNIGNTTARLQGCFFNEITYIINIFGCLNSYRIMDPSNGYYLCLKKLENILKKLEIIFFFYENI